MPCFNFVVVLKLTLWGFVLAADVNDRNSDRQAQFTREQIQCFMSRQVSNETGSSSRL